MELCTMSNERISRKGDQFAYLSVKAITVKLLNILSYNREKVKVLSQIMTKEIELENANKTVHFLTVQKRLYDVVLVLKGLSLVEMAQKKVHLLNNFERRKPQRRVNYSEVDQRKARIRKLQEKIREMKKYKENLENLTKRNRERFEAICLNKNKIYLNELCAVVTHSLSVKVQVKAKAEILVPYTSKVYSNMELLTQLSSK